MRTKIVKGTGVQGILLNLSVCDMFAADQMSKMLEEVVKSNEEIRKYEATPYDKRAEQYPNGHPKKVELPDKAIEELYVLMCKMSYSAKSTLFKGADEDEPWPEGADNDIDE